MVKSLTVPMDQPWLDLVRPVLQGSEEAWNNLLYDPLSEIRHVCVVAMGFFLAVEQKLQPSSESLLP